MSLTPALKYPVLYFRGLNTQGDDNLRFGRLALGPMHARWAKQLKRKNINVIAVAGRGGGPLREQIEAAKNKILAMDLWKSPEMRFHFLAHSTGGLVARALVHELKEPLRILSVSTIASPHQGSWLAEMIPSLPDRRPYLNRFLKAMNYRIEEKLSAYHDLTTVQVAQFNLLYPDIPGVDYGSAVFASKEKDLSWPVRMAKRMVDPKGEIESDGIVARQAQNWGKVFHEGELDHMNQIGYNLRLNPKAYFRAKKEFLSLVDKAVDFMRFSESTQPR